jgi:O-antigen/teichoic acid export membrane protein
LALLAGLAVVAAPQLLERLLPDYQAGLAPLLWIVPGAVAQAMALPAGQYLVAIDRQNRALVVVAIAALLAAAGDYLAVAGGYGLVGVAAATSGAYVVYYVLSVATALWGELDRQERTRYIAMMGLALAPTIGLAIVLERLWPGNSTSWTLTAGKLGAVAAVWATVAWTGWRCGGWGSELRGERSKARGENR